MYGWTQLPPPVPSSADVEAARVAAEALARWRRVLEAAGFRVSDRYWPDEPAAAGVPIERVWA